MIPNSNRNWRCSWFRYMPYRERRSSSMLNSTLEGILEDDELAAEEEERAEQERKKKLEEQRRPEPKGIVIRDEEDRQPSKSGTESVGIGGEKISMGVGEERIQTGKLRARIHWFAKNREGKRNLGKITETEERFGVNEERHFITTDQRNPERRNSPVFIRERECMSTSRNVRSAERFPSHHKKDSLEHIELNDFRNARDSSNRASMEQQKQGNISIVGEACSSRSITQMGDQRLYREMPRERNLPFAKGDARERMYIGERLAKWRPGEAAAMTSRRNPEEQQIIFSEQSGPAGTSYPFYMSSEGPSSCARSSAMRNMNSEDSRRAFQEQPLEQGRSSYQRGGLSRRDIERRIHSKDYNRTGKESETRSAFHIPRFQNTSKDVNVTGNIGNPQAHKYPIESQGKSLLEKAENLHTEPSTAYCAYKSQFHGSSFHSYHVDKIEEIPEHQRAQENIFVQLEHTTAEHRPQFDFTIPNTQIENKKFPDNEKKDSLALLYRSVEDIVPSAIWNVQEENIPETLNVSNQEKITPEQLAEEKNTSPLSMKSKSSSVKRKVPTNTRLNLRNVIEKQMTNKPLVAQVKSPVKIDKKVLDKYTKKCESPPFVKKEQRVVHSPKCSRVSSPTRSRVSSSPTRQPSPRFSGIPGDRPALRDTPIKKEENVVVRNKSPVTILKKSPQPLKRPSPSKIEEKKTPIKIKVSDTAIKEKSKSSLERKVSPLSKSIKETIDTKSVIKSPVLKKDEGKMTKQKQRDIGYTEHIRSYSSSEVSDIEGTRGSNISKRGKIKTLRSKNREIKSSEKKISCSSSEEKVPKPHKSSYNILKKEIEKTFKEKAKEKTNTGKTHPLESICEKNKLKEKESTEKISSLLSPANREKLSRSPERKEEKKDFLPLENTEKLSKRRKDTSAAGKKKATRISDTKERQKLDEDGDVISLSSESDTKRKTRSYKSRYKETEDDSYYISSSDADSSDSVIRRIYRKRRRGEDDDKFKKSRARKKTSPVSRRDEDENSRGKHRRSSIIEREYAPRKYIHVREVTPEISREECLSLISMTDDRDEILSLLSQSEIGLGVPLIYRSDSEDDYLPHYYRDRDSGRGDHTIIVTKEGGHRPEIWDDEKFVNRKRYSNIDRIRILGDRRRIGRRRRSRDRRDRTIIIERRPPRERWSLRERRKADDRRRARERVRLDRLLSYAREDYPEDPVVIIMPRQDPWETEEIAYRPRSPVRDRDFDYCRDVEAGPSSRPDIFYGYRQYDYEPTSERPARTTNVQCENIHKVYPKDKYPIRSRSSQTQMWDFTPSAPSFLTNKSDAWTDYLMDQKNINLEVHTAFPGNQGKAGLGATVSYKQLSEKNFYRTQQQEQLQRSQSPTIQLYAQKSPMQMTPQSSSFNDGDATTPTRIRSVLKRPGSISSTEKHCHWSEYNLVVEHSSARPESKGLIHRFLSKVPMKLCIPFTIRTIISITAFILMILAYNRGLGQSREDSPIEKPETNLNTYAFNKEPKNFLMNCNDLAATVRVSFNGPFIFTYQPDPAKRHFNYQFERWYLNKLTFNPRYIRRPEWPGETRRFPKWERTNCTLWLIEVKHTSSRLLYTMTIQATSVRSMVSFVPGYRDQKGTLRQAHAKDLGQFRYVNVTYSYITRTENSEVTFAAAPMNTFKLKKYRFYGYKLSPYTSEYYEYEEVFEDFRKVPGRILPKEQILANGTHDDDLEFVYALRYVLDISKDVYAPPFIVELNAPVSNTTEKDEMFYSVSAFSIRPGIGMINRNSTNSTDSMNSTNSTDSALSLPVENNSNNKKLHKDGLKWITYLLGGTLLMILLRLNLTSIIFIVGVFSISLMSYLEIWNPDRMLMRVRCDELLYLLYTMILITLFADTGIFGYAAFYLRVIFKEKTGALLSILCTITIFLTILFTNNVFSMQIMTLFGIRCSEEYNMNPVPLLILLSILSNIAGIMTSSSSYVSLHFFQLERLQQAYKSFAALPIAMLFTFMVTSTFAFSYFVFIFKIIKPHIYESVKIQELKQEVKLWEQIYYATDTESHHNILVRYQIMRMIQKLKEAIKDEEVKLGSDAQGERSIDADPMAEPKVEECYIKDANLLFKVIVSAVLFVFFNFLRKFHFCLAKDSYCFDEVSIMWSLWTGLGILLIMTDPNFNLLMRRLDWATIITYVSLLFVQELVSSLNLHVWLTENIFEYGGLTLNGYFKTLFFSSASAATITYIPFIDMWISFLKEVSEIWPNYDIREIFGVINIGLNLGASVTLLGSPATITCMNLSAQQGYQISYLCYLKYALPITVFNLFIASATYILII